MLALKILAGFILVLGLGSTAISSYLFFVVLPPMLSGVEQTAQYLSAFKAPEMQLQDSAEKVRRAADSIPGCPQQQFGGCAIFDLRETKAELNGLADSIENTNADIKAEATSLQAQVHQTGLQLLYIRPMMLATVGWMLSVSIAMILSGAVFLLIDRSLEKRIRVLQNSRDARDSIAT